MGHIDEGQALLEESLAINQRANDRWGLGTCYGNLGLVAQARGDWNAARSLFRQAVEMFRELGARGYTAEYLVHLGEASAASEDETEPEKIFRDAIRVASQAQATPSVADAIVGLASLLARSGKKPESLVEWLYNHFTRVNFHFLKRYPREIIRLLGDPMNRKTIANLALFGDFCDTVPSWRNTTLCSHDKPGDGCLLR